MKSIDPIDRGVIASIFAACALVGVYAFIIQKSYAQPFPQYIQHYADPSSPYPYKYNNVAASATATVLTGGGGGAAGDYISNCVIYPATTTPGLVTVFDGTNTAANSIIAFPGGTTTVAPIPIQLGAVSKNGAWKVTTGLSVSVACTGSFT
jgi:hypothetical protein